VRACCNNRMRRPSTSASASSTSSWAVVRFSAFSVTPGDAAISALVELRADGSLNTTEIAAQAQPVPRPDVMNKSAAFSNRKCEVIFYFAGRSFPRRRHEFRTCRKNSEIESRRFRGSGSPAIRGNRKPVCGYGRRYSAKPASLGSIAKVPDTSPRRRLPAALRPPPTP
jgi:hypothetical protein